MTEEQRIAEEFRRHLQSKYRHEILKPKLPPQEILSQRLKLAEQRLQASGSPPEAVAKTMHELRTRLKQVELVTEDDEPFSRSIVEGLCRDIEKVCLQRNIPLHGGVARGIVESLSIDATLHPAPFSETGVLSLSRGFIVLCSHLSKLLAITLVIDRQEEFIRVNFDPQLVQTRFLADSSIGQYWLEVIGMYAFNVGPVRIRPRIVDEPLTTSIRVPLLVAMEWFTVAHEYGHHIARDGKFETASVGIAEDSVEKELNADCFGLAMSRLLGNRSEPQNIYAESGAGAVALLKCLECIERARQILDTGKDQLKEATTHPTIEARINAFDSLDSLIPEPFREQFKDMRRCLIEIFSYVWTKLAPVFHSLHEQGLRPFKGTANNPQTFS